MTNMKLQYRYRQRISLTLCVSHQPFTLVVVLACFHFAWWHCCTVHIMDTAVHINSNTCRTTGAALFYEAIGPFAGSLGLAFQNKDLILTP